MYDCEKLYQKRNMRKTINSFLLKFLIINAGMICTSINREKCFGSEEMKTIAGSILVQNGATVELSENEKGYFIEGTVGVTGGESVATNLIAKNPVVMTLNIEQQFANWKNSIIDEANAIAEGYTDIRTQLEVLDSKYQNGNWYLEQEISRTISCLNSVIGSLNDYLEGITETELNNLSSAFSALCTATVELGGTSSEVEQVNNMYNSLPELNNRSTNVSIKYKKYKTAFGEYSSAKKENYLSQYIQEFKDTGFMTDRRLILCGNAKADFRNSLTLDSFQIEMRKDDNNVVPTLQVAGKLKLVGATFWDRRCNENIIINMRKLAEAENENTDNSLTEEELLNADDAVIDVSELSYHVLQPYTITFNGASKYGQTLLEYYNPADADNLAITEIKNASSDKKNKYVNNIKYRIKQFFYYNNIEINFNGVKMQDYVIDETGVGVECNNNEIEYKFDSISNLLVDDSASFSGFGSTSCSGLHHLINERNVTIIDATNVDYDFYANFIGVNLNTNSFVKWPKSVQLPLSSIDENYDYGENKPTEFEFKTNINPSEGNEYDLSVSNGLVKFNTLKLSGNNSNFKNRLRLNGLLNKVIFSAPNSYVAIDSTSVQNDTIYLSFSDNSGTNTIKTAPIIGNHQIIKFDTGSNNTIIFSTPDASDDTTTRLYKFNECVIKSGTTVHVTKNATLVV